VNHARTYTLEQAMRSKRVLSGEVVPQWHDPCAGYHLQPAEKAPLPKRAAPRDTGPDRATRAAVLARDGHACVCCGVSVTGRRYSLQHRLRRSQGGTSAMSNLVTALGDGSTGCHARMDSRRDPADELHGYTVRSGQDPRLIGVMYFKRPGGSGVTLWLENDGGLLPAPPEGAEAVA
jgi:hypothetical protein